MAAGYNEFLKNIQPGVRPKVYDHRFSADDKSKPQVAYQVMKIDVDNVYPVFSEDLQETPVERKKSAYVPEEHFEFEIKDEVLYPHLRELFAQGPLVGQ